MPVSFKPIKPTEIELPLLNNLSKDCPICMCPLSDGPSTAHKANETFHAFHTNCLSTWLKRKNTCPICVQPVNSMNGKAVSQSAPPQSERAKKCMRLFSFILGVLGAGFLYPVPFLGILCLIAALLVFVSSCHTPPSDTTLSNYEALSIQRG